MTSHYSTVHEVKNVIFSQVRAKRYDLDENEVIFPTFLKKIVFKLFYMVFTFPPSLNLTFRLIACVRLFSIAQIDFSD